MCLFPSLSIQVSSEENKTLTKNPDKIIVFEENVFHGHYWTWTFTIAEMVFLASRLGWFCSCCCVLLYLRKSEIHNTFTEEEPVMYRVKICEMESKPWPFMSPSQQQQQAPKMSNRFFFFTRKGHKSRTFMVAERPKLINGILLVSTTVFKQVDDQLK